MDASSLVSSSGARGDYAIARKALDQLESEGEAIISLIQSAGSVGASSRGAVSPAAGAGETGQNLDRRG